MASFADIAGLRFRFMSSVEAVPQEAGAPANQKHRRKNGMCQNTTLINRPEGRFYFAHAAVPPPSTGSGSGSTSGSDSGSGS